MAEPSEPQAQPRPPPAEQLYPSHYKSQQDQELIRLALHKSPFFTCLDEEQIERLVATASLQAFEPEEIVILEGCVDQDDDTGSGSNDDNTTRIPTPTRHFTSVGPAEFDEVEDYDDAVAKEEVSQIIEMGSEHESKIDDTVAAGSQTREKDIEHKNQVDETDSENDEDDETRHEPLVTLTSADDDDKSFNNTNRFVPRRNDTSLPPPPQSNVKRSIYIVRKGNADVWYQSTDLNPASLGPGTLFGEGGFLFGRQHSASVLAGRHEPLECYVVDINTFRNYILPSHNMSRLFDRYAKQSDEQGKYMTMQDFVQACQRQDDGGSLPPTLPDPLVGLRIANTYQILQQRKHDNPNQELRIYLPDFCFFHLLMARPDPEVDIAFLLMDQRQTGQIDLQDVAQFVQPVFPDLDLTSEFFQRYFGPDGNQSIRQTHFSQFLMDLQREMGQQAFFQAVAETGVNGHLLPSDFVRVLKTACGWRLPTGVADRLESIYCQGPIEAGEAAAMVSLRSGSLKRATVKEVTKSTEASVLAGMEQREKNLGDRYFGYGDFLAFQEVLANLPGICNLIDHCQEIKKGPVSADDFKVANRVMGLGGRLSRRQVDIIFQLFDLDRDGYVSHEDTVSVCGVDFAQILVAETGRGGKLTFAPPPEYRHQAVHDGDDDEQPKDKLLSEQVGSYLQHAALISVASALGVVVLYPLDLVKTRMMNMRVPSLGGERMYANSLDCLQHALRGEGFVGLYRGLLPQLLGVAPEKAIKLQVNDLMRQAFSSIDESTGDRKLGLSVEVFAGACAGACQLLVTNPMEVVKIRLQMQGETARLMRAKGLSPPSTTPSMQSVIRELGYPGLYRGASACLLRDIPFSAIYFPTYTACKEFLVHQNRSTGKATPSDLLLAGTLAGVPAALLTTPADVIKTRLQTIARPGEASYDGIADCAKKMYQQEGLASFFRGSAARVARIAPQFGISLLAYEKLSEWVGLQGTAYSPPTNAPVDPEDYHTAFPARAIQPKTKDIDSWLRNFGFYGSTTEGDPSRPSDSSNSKKKP